MCSHIKEAGNPLYLVNECVFKMQIRTWHVHKTTALDGPDVCYVPRAAVPRRGAFASLMEAYRAAVPAEALVPSASNTWHVKMFQAVAQQDAQLSSGEGQRVCKEDSSLTCVYIYVSH